jgi:hypothetical protein
MVIVGSFSGSLAALVAGLALVAQLPGRLIRDRHGRCRDKRHGTQVIPAGA